MGAPIDKELVAAEAITAVETGISERDALNRMSEKYNITDWRIRGAIHSLVFETLRRLNTIDLLIKNSLEKGTIDKLYPLLRNLLRIGVYILKSPQLNVPPPKITSFIVEVSKDRFGESVSKFTNALLRKIENMKLDDLITDSTDIEKLSFQYNHPIWFIEYLIDLIGFPDTIKFLKKSIEENGFYIRVNTLKTDLSSVVDLLEREEFTFSVDQDLPDVIAISRWKYPIMRSTLNEEGLIYVQDKASALISHVINPQEGDIIFDLCAAPGGKSMHLGQLLQNTGMILSIDRSSRRLLELSTKLSKYGLRNIYVINAVGENGPKYIRERADKVLIDPPCSGTGTFDSRPYSKWKFQMKELEILTSIQWKLLIAAEKTLKSSGEIVYSTCSITLEENEHLIKKFLRVFPDFTLVPATPFIGVPGFLGLSETQRLYPYLHDTEGFFIAKLKRE
ncbi:MAG: RsmB/NOP family class I SAM-dependent RNA methyltransferase [Candidatus Helarchaeota archaeon]|nr:RsmB/NOP family class I SAM-dependent RNA methyltransferase [Candidatus Helarchaeota archaeon]